MLRKHLSHVIATACLAGCFPMPPEVPIGEGSDAAGLAEAGVPSPDLMNSPDLESPVSCSPANCAGCCQGGVCQPGNSASACGRDGAACLLCPARQTCLNTQTCGPDPSGIWDLIVEQARVSANGSDGLAWDFPGGAPDPFVTFNGSQATSVDSDTHSPVWFQGRSFSLRELQSGVSISMWDEDLASNDRIAGPRLLTVTAADLQAGRIEWRSWDYCLSVAFSLRPR